MSSSFFFLVFGGLPLLGVFLMASNTSFEYKLPLKIGSYPALKILCATVLYGKPKMAAISSIVIPFIAFILHDFLRVVNKVE